MEDLGFNRNELIESLHEKKRKQLKVNFTLPLLKHLEEQDSKD